MELKEIIHAEKLKEEDSIKEAFKILEPLVHLENFI